MKMFVFVSWKKQMKMLFFTSWLVYFGVWYSYTLFLCCGEKLTPNKKYLLELIKRSSEVQEKNISCEHAFNFDQWKTFSKNYKPMRVWLWLVYKFTENYCCLRPSPSSFKLRRGIIPLLAKFLSELENYSYQAKFFLVN